MPRKKSGKSSSIMVSDISNSQLHFPLATSSPRESAKCESSSSLDEQLKDLQERANEMLHKKAQEIEDIFHSKMVKLEVVIKEMLGKYPEDALVKPVKASDIKTLKSTYSSSKSLNGTSSKKRTHTELKNESILPCIPEENDTSAKRRNKVQFSADEDDGVFKKPTGRGKRTLKNSQKFSSSSVVILLSNLFGRKLLQVRWEKTNGAKARSKFYYCSKKMKVF